MGWLRNNFTMADLIGGVVCGMLFWPVMNGLMLLAFVVSEVAK